MKRDRNQTVGRVLQPQVETAPSREGNHEVEALKPDFALRGPA